MKIYRIVEVAYRNDYLEREKIYYRIDRRNPFYIWLLASLPIYWIPLLFGMVNFIWKEDICNEIFDDYNKAYAFLQFNYNSPLNSFKPYRKTRIIYKLKTK